MKNSFTFLLLTLFILPLVQCTVLGPDDSDDRANSKYDIFIFSDISKIFLEKDAALIQEAEIKKDSLILTVAYSGGCKNHEFKLFGWSGFAKSNPPQAEIYLSHNANEDLCEAWITRKVSFNLVPLKEVYKRIFNNKGPFLLRIYAPGSEEPFEPKPLYELN